MADPRSVSQPPIVRVYRGAQQADANAAFRSDAVELAKYGYVPTTQSWAQGQWGCGAFLVALLLCILLIGFLVFIFMLVVKPDGTLTVTYEFQGVAAATKICPRCAETIKKEAKVCRFCGNEFQWTPTHRVPDGGLAAWAAPNPSLPPIVTLDAGLGLIVAERAGDWGRVEADNGWTGWVDARLLIAKS